MTENKTLRKRLSEAHDAAAAAAADHSKVVSALREEIADLRILCSAAETTQTIVASLTDENMVLFDDVRALKGRVTELEDLLEMSRM
jgi:hypothetical protein